MAEPRSFTAHVRRTVLLLGLAAVLSVAGALSWQWGKAALQRDAYRARLADLEAKHNALVADYNRAVARTAVCEVRQEGGKLKIVVRTADGRSEEIPLPFDPSREVHFDFVCLDNRLQLRRVYDDQTAPKDGVLVESKLAQVDWHGHEDDRGLAIYRPLTEGRYALKVSGTGSLTLEKLEAGEIARLEREPRLRRYDTVEPMKNADAEPGIGEVWRGLWK